MFFLSPHFSFPLCGCYLGSLPTWSAPSPTTTYLIFLRHAQFLTALKQKPQWLPVPYKIKSKLSLAFKIPIINSNQHPSSQTSLQPVLIKSLPPLPFILPLPFLLSRSFYFHAVIFFALRMSFPCLSASPNLAQFLKDLPNSTLSLRFPCPFCNWVPVKVYLTFCGPCLFYLIISLNTLFSCQTRTYFSSLLLPTAPSTLSCMQQVFYVCWMNEGKYFNWFYNEHE